MILCNINLSKSRCNEKLCNLSFNGRFLNAQREGAKLPSIQDVQKGGSFVAETISDLFCFV